MTKWICLLVVVCVILLASPLVITSGYAAGNCFYTIKHAVNLRSGPNASSRSVLTLPQNSSVTKKGQKGDWAKVRTHTGQTGFIRLDVLSDMWIKVHKRERSLFLMQGSNVLKTYNIALCQANPLGDKHKQGDGATPEGRFFVSESIKTPKKAKYGARSMRLNYPARKHARHGLKDGLITYAEYKTILRAHNLGQTPPQNTALGGSIRIHGGGNKGDWTLGCIAMDDADIMEMYDLVPKRVRVEVYKSAKQDAFINAEGAMMRAIKKGMQEQLDNPALYTNKACGEISMGYPMGDIMPGEAVCTDVVIRALRKAGIDLQALLHEDILRHRNRYKRWVKSPNYRIDQRRTRNLQIFFENNARVLPQDIHTSPKTFLPGDIVIMDAVVANGLKFDHVGLVSNEKNIRGKPMVFNIWTTGYRTKNMDLLGKDYPEVVGHFRLGHLFDYQ